MLRYRIASFDTDIPPGPIGMEESPAGEEIMKALQQVLSRKGYDVDDVELGGYNISWVFTLRINQSRVLVELFGAHSRQPIPWCLFVVSATGCLWFFRAKPDDIIAGHHVVDEALRDVDLIRRVRWHEEGPTLGSLGPSKPHPE